MVGSPQEATVLFTPTLTFTTATFVHVWPCPNPLNPISDMTRFGLDLAEREVEHLPSLQIPCEVEETALHRCKY